MDFDSSTDPAAEFLAREQDQLAGIGDDIITGTEPAAAPADEETLDAGASPDNQGFEILGTEGRGDAGFDPISAPLDAGPAGDVQPQAPAPAAAPSPTPVPRIEPEKIRRWREEQKARLEEKDEEEERKKAEWREAAKKELEDWYKQHEESVSKTRAANRAAEKELVSGEAKSTERAADWEQIAKLCEFNPKVSRNTKDTSRMRSLILQLKQNPPVKSG
ncbi:Clathrin light chain [Amphibalanus amphitrite]|uniref:Clathrin light chain n=1 Tax=Amphibalanus amphitrite TaxID=1232801 RepID=A0A6A4VTL1_AMPAM|nr:clathrin light chain-like isoform X1 [Amphibalanus amphitrite]XP_043242821.1 clathrin light chain-like isoform X1 [Amphibalanus amphitrite]XP_043242822.1 clathrin light chain-like isoform X1 [Amphibalanus amphitrite]XP_043242823.1 clathrin light chain-like isoform X1 [Amphibalanus amphitrite]KAF0294964.1 Clathrin light chain [Amphibalanus amphitrite]